MQERKRFYYPERPEYFRISREVSISPEQLQYYLGQHPIDKHFIGWVADQNYQIQFKSLESAKGYTQFSERTVLIKQGMSKKESDLTIMHELIHVAFPYAHGYARSQPSEGLEEAIDEIAKPYSANEEFMKYVRSTIPTFSVFKQTKVVFPTLPISDRLDIKFI